MMKTDAWQRTLGAPAAPHGKPAKALTAGFLKNSEAILRLAMRSLFERLNNMCEGAIAVDAQARIVWISDKYLATLGLSSADEALGKEVEEVLPNSLMREVVRTGQPLLLDIMAFGEQSLVVTRMPILDEDGKVIGAIGFVLYDRVHYLKPLVAKFASLQSELADAQRKLVQNRRTRFTLSSFVGGSACSLEVKPGEGSGAAKRYSETLAEFERKTLRSALRECDGKVAVTAKMLGMSRAGLYRKLSLLGISSRD
jgi:transcriptional regulator with PAS, ATPase and Fis domain